MCGIYGYFDRRGLDGRRNVLDRMARSIAHRGPDDNGIEISNAGAIGCVRLAIIDVEGGHQPMSSDDGTICVAQNGEIYNFLEIRSDLEKKGIRFRTHSDTEVLLRLYEAEGIGMLRRLNGMFAFAIYDARKGHLFIARDRLGVKPLYIYDDGQCIFFASEIKALLQCGAPRRPNLSALRHFAELGYVPPAMCAFEGIQPVPPGTYLVITRTKQECVRWWRIENAAAEEHDESFWIDVLTQRLDDAVRIRLRSDVPFGLFLSGGIDSSTVAAFAGRRASTPLKSFTISFPDPAFDESRFAEIAAHRFRTDHHCEAVRPDILDHWPVAVYFADQPHSDSSFLPVWRVSTLAARHVKMVLTGDGGDELFAGYDKHRAMGDSAEFRSGTCDGLAQAWLGSSRMLKADAETSFAPEFLESTKDARIDDVVHEALGQCDRMDPVNRILYLDTMLLLPGNNLVKPDRMAMAVGLEARSPFLDCDLVETAFRIPGSLKLRGGRTKYILKRTVEGLIGRELTERSKQQFTMPIGDWLRAQSASLADRLLTSNRCIKRGIFSAGFISQVVTEHRQKTANHTQLIRSMVSLELWFRMFIDNLYERPAPLEELL